MFQHRRLEDTDEKEDLKPTFSYQLYSRKKANFSYIKGVHRTYVTVANQSTVHRTNPNRRKEIQYQRTATQITETPQLLLRVTNHSERTLLLGDRHTNCISRTFLLDRKNIIGRNQFFFSTPDSVNTTTVFTESPTKKYLHFANFQKAGQPLKEVSLDRQKLQVIWHSLEARATS